MLKLNQVSLQRGQKVLLDKATLVLPQQCVCGIIGRNGAGKSSLFSVIQGQLTADGGELSIPLGKRWAAMEQELPDGREHLLSFVCHGDPEWSAITGRLAKAEQDGDGTVIAEAYADLETIDGYTIEARSAKVLAGLGFPSERINDTLSTFSGGWQMRAQLARVLMTRADLLLLDEPTNHLDLETVSYLESWLQATDCAVLIISHDREFLDATTNYTVHLANQQLKLYQGDYTSFLRQFSEALVLQEKMHTKVAAKRAHLQKFVDRFKAKASKAKQAQSRVKALEKLKFSADLVEESSFSFDFLPVEPLSYPTLSLRGKCGYGDTVILDDVDWSLGPDERIGVIGVNGAGKSTFLKSIAGQLKLVDGICEEHPDLKVGYYSQYQLDNLDLQSNPLQIMQEHFPGLNETEVRARLGRFAFAQTRVFDKIENFSGGERARLALAILVYQKPNLLILDEPTNHLDMPMREALINALQNFSGSVLLVSHDRYLLECVCDQLLAIADHKVQSFSGNLDEYTQQVREQRLSENKVKKNKKKKKSESGKGSGEGGSNQSNKSSKKAQKLEKQINKIQKELADLDDQLTDVSLYTPVREDDLRSLQKRRAELQQRYEHTQAKWLDEADD